MKVSKFKSINLNFALKLNMIDFINDISRTLPLSFFIAIAPAVDCIGAFFSAMFICNLSSYLKSAKHLHGDSVHKMNKKG